MSKGIDVYTAYQQVADWSAVRRAGYEFAYIKVSDGLTARATNGYPAAAKRAGVKAGAYHYAQKGDPVAQANYFITRAKSEGALDLAPALDLEAPFVPGSAAATFAIAFLERVKALGHRPALYGNNNMLFGPAGIAAAVRKAVPEVLIWVARYGKDPDGSYDVWQHSSSGHVPGITASGVDLNTGALPLNIPQEDEMPLTNDDVRKIWFGAPGLPLINDRLAGESSCWPGDMLGSIAERTSRQVEHDVAALVRPLLDAAAKQAVQVDLDVLAAKVAAKLGTVTIDYAALAKAVNDDAAKRMQS